MSVTLYGFPGACSLAPHIGLVLAGIPHKYVAVDKATGKADGVDFKTINPAGAVPALKLEDGTIIAQNQAILWWIGQKSKKVSYSADSLGQVRLIEGYGMTSDLHTGVASHLFANASADGWKRRMGELEARLPSSGWVLGGSEPTGVDLLTAVMVNWNNLKGVDISAYPKSKALQEKVFSLPEAQEALKSEGLI